MKKFLCSYANKRYLKSLRSLEKTAIEIGKVDKVCAYTREWLETTDFYKKNIYILNMPRGNGYWIYKPYIILKTLESMEEGDIVMYTDAGITPLQNLQSLYDLADIHEKIIFQNAGHNNKTWTKRDCFVIMNCDEKKYWDGMQVTATFSLWKKTIKNIDFLNEWQRYLRDVRIVTDEPNMCGLPNFIEFKDHRHDQSVLSLMAIKYNIELFRDPGQFGIPLKDKFPNSTYEQLFDHHRQNK